MSTAPRSPRLPPRWFIRLAWSTHRGLYRVSRGRFGLRRPKPDGWGILRLTTIGRRTGQERGVMLGYFVDGSNLVTMAMNGWGEPEPAWWLNLQAHPDARAELPDGQRLVTGRAAAGDERERLWARWREIDKNLDAYAARRSGQTAVVVLEPRRRVTTLNELDAHEQQALLRRRDVSAVELLDAHLAAVDARNGDVNAIVALDRDIGRRRAEAVDAALDAGDDPGRLAGLVTAHKDLTETVDFPTTYGSPLFAGHRPARNSLLVERMTAAGAVAIGKTNTPEFGAGSHAFNPVYGTTRNPFDPERSAGGSSGGAAAALATHMVAVADGSDYGGSLRNPAAWNGVIGLRPSLGVVPHVDPGNAYLRLGTTGPMARTIDDLALLFGVLSRPDLRDPASRGLEVPARIDPADGPLRVAWSDHLGGLPVEHEITTVLRRLRTRFDRLGWTVEDAEPDFAGADECFETLRSWRVANGQAAHLGERVTEVKTTIRDEIDRGRALTQEQVALAFEHMQVLWRRAVSFFADYDLLVAPVTQVNPFPADWEYPTEVAGVPMERYITWMRSACRITSLQVPALSLPAGVTATGLPVGAQLVGGPRGDLALLRAAKAVELAS